MNKNTKKRLIVGVSHLADNLETLAQSPIGDKKAYSFIKNLLGASVPPFMIVSADLRIIVKYFRLWYCSENRQQF